MKRIVLVFLIVLVLVGCSSKKVTTDFETELTKQQQKEFLDYFHKIEFSEPFTYYDDGTHTMNFSFINFYITDGKQEKEIGIRPELGLVKYENHIYVINPFNEFFDIVRDILQSNGIENLGLLLNADSPIIKFKFEEMYQSEQMKEGYDFNYEVWCCSGYSKISDVMVLIGYQDDTELTVMELFLNNTDIAEININEVIEYNDCKIKCVQKTDLQGFEYGFLLMKE